VGPHTTSSLYSITTFPDHGADGSAAHIWYQLAISELQRRPKVGLHLISPGKNGLLERSWSVRSSAKRDKYVSLGTHTVLLEVLLASS
jgi:hypothetical protein